MREYHEKKVMTKNRNFWIGAEIARSGNNSKKYGKFHKAILYANSVFFYK